MNIPEVRKLLDPQFGYWAKSSGELLYAHHFAVWSIFKKIASFCPSLKEDKEEQNLLEMACLLHDIGKMRKEVQDFLHGRTKEKPPHKVVDIGEMQEYLMQASFNIGSQKEKEIVDIIRTHHSISKKDLVEIDTAGAGFFTSLLSTADYLASMEQISYETITDFKQLYNKKVNFAVVQYSRMQSPSANLIISEISNIYKEKGWKIIVIPEGGILFVSEPATSLPAKEDIVKRIFEKIIEKSLSLQEPNFRNFTKQMLVGISAKHPKMFLNAQKDRFLDAFGNVDEKGPFWLKLVKDILDINNVVTSEMRRTFPVLDIIISASGTRGVREARKKWAKLRGGSGAEKLADIIQEIFNERNIGEVLPQEFVSSVKELKPEMLLSSLKPQGLFKIVEDIADKFEKETEFDIALKKYLSCTIMAEEETNFREISQSSFDAYKIYKRTAKAERGVCERCACPVVFTMQPSLGFRDGASTSSSQIKAKYADRAICPLCAYDNLVLRQATDGNRMITLYLRLETKVPDLLANYEEIGRLVRVIIDGIRSPRNIVKLEERKTLVNLPFPRRIAIPVAEENEDTEALKPILQVDNGILFRLGRDIQTKNFTPKDARVQYEPLFHVMKFLGFKTSIGAEEQEGLFGEEIETNEENYYLSLATILLAYIVGKDTNKYIFARSLIEKSPSSAIGVISAAEEEGTKRHLSSDCLRRLIKFLLLSKTKIVKWKGGEIDMEGLIKDAAFFADKEKGIPHFCVEPEDRGDFWQNLSKHKAAKPVAQALDAMLTSQQFDLAVERFVRNLSIKIPNEEQNALKVFTEKSKEILKKYHDLRLANISEFIKAKNSLISAIFMMTRYQALKEVLDE